MAAVERSGEGGERRGEVGARVAADGGRFGVMVTGAAGQKTIKYSGGDGDRQRAQNAAPERSHCGAKK